MKLSSFHSFFERKYVFDKYVRMFDKYFLYETEGLVSLFSYENEGMWFADVGQARRVFSSRDTRVYDAFLMRNRWFCASANALYIFISSSNARPLVSALALRCRYLSGQGKLDWHVLQDLVCLIGLPAQPSSQPAQSASGAL